MPKIKEFLRKYEAKIVLIMGLILVAIISFEFGLIQGKKWQDRPLVIESPVLAQNTNSQNLSEEAPQAQNPASEDKTIATNTNTQPQQCAFVGSKNSDKYHLPTCRWAKQIKPENLVCFASAEDATAKGYQPDKNCIK